MSLVCNVPRTSSVVSKDISTTISSGNNVTVWLVVLFGAIGGILFGMDQANFAGVETKESFARSFCVVPKSTGNWGTLDECLGRNDQEVPHGMTIFESWGSSLVQLGAAAGALILGPPITSRFGRRAGLFIGSMIVTLAMIWSVSWTNLLSFYCSRFMTGLGVGIVTFALPMWTAELAPKEIRGALGCTMQLAVVIGSQIAAGINIPQTVTWQNSLAAPIAPAVVVMLFIYFFPESPRHVFQTNGAQAARTVLVKLRGTDQVDAELNDIESSLSFETKQAPWSVLWTDPSIRRRVIIANMLQWMQQFTGINALLGQGPKLYAASGIDLDPNVANFITNSFNLAGTIIMMVVIDKWGRRRLLLAGAVGMFFFMSSAGFLVYFFKSSLVAMWMLLGCCCLYFLSFAIAWGGIPWVYPSEIFPMDVKEKALSTSVCSQWIANWVVAFLTPYQIDKWGSSDIRPAPTFFFYSIFIVFNFAFVYFYVPEIKGVALEDMDTIFGERQYINTNAEKEAAYNQVSTPVVMIKELV